MNLKLPSSAMLHSALLFARVSLAMLFLLAGAKKMIPSAAEGTMQKIETFANSVADDAPLPRPLGLAYGYALPFAEIIAGLLLTVGLFGRIAALVITLMLLSFMIAIGIGWWPATGSAFDRNVILFTTALLLSVTGPGVLSIDGLIRNYRRNWQPRK